MTVQEIDPEIRALLNVGEEILLTASQARAVPGGSLTTPNKIYITNIRIIFKDPKWFGLKANIIDVNYQDISNVRLKRGVFSTEIFLKSRFLSAEVGLPAVDKQIAQQVMGYIQKGIRGELPRQMIAQDKNAPTIEVKSKSEKAPMDKLRELTELKDKGVLSEGEFQRIKSELLKELGIKALDLQDIAANMQQARSSNSLMIQCSNCKSEIPQSSKFCPECGNVTQPITKKCAQCSTEVKNDAKFCANCGQKL